MIYRRTYFQHKTGVYAISIINRTYRALHLKRGFILNRLDLASDAAHARQQLVFLANRMTHAALSQPPYPIQANKDGMVTGTAELYERA